MSGFAVVFERSNTAVEADVLDRILDRLSHRGPDGKGVWIQGPIGMGHWHFWTTPEEVGENQPIRIRDAPFWIVLDGRLDNRAELISRLKLPLVEARQYSDAEIILHVYDQFGEAGFTKLIGEFSFVICDLREFSLICVRDGLGNRTLYYANDGTRVFIGSEPWAIVCGLDHSPELDERSVASYFALDVPSDGRTYFRGVTELLPGHSLLINSSRNQLSRYWFPQPEERERKKSDEEYAEEFRSILEESIQCRLRSVNPPAILMSGGLDSTSVACLAARLVAPNALTTISYVFDQFPECDERKYIQAVQEKYGTKSILFNCDQDWPYQTNLITFQNPNGPDQNPYRPLIEHVYGQIQKSKIKVYLTGVFGDDLYLDSIDWFWDLIRDRRTGFIVEEINYLRQNKILLKSLKSGGLRRAVRRTVNLLPGGKSIRKKVDAKPWLTPHAKKILGKPEEVFEPDTNSHLLDYLGGNSLSLENPITSYFQVEPRHPYRDQRLIEYALSLPAYQLLRHGQPKRILRIAMQGILPEIIRLRRKPTGLHQLYNYGIGREKQKFESFFRDRDGSWTMYVNQEWLASRWDQPISFEADGPDTLIGWMCYSYEEWKKKSSLI